MTRVLHISASGRRDASISRRLSKDLLDALEARHGELDITTRDLSKGISFVDEAWIGATFTNPADRSDEQRAVLAESDELVAELEAADIVVIGTPIYNFGVPATLKAWVDMIARAQLTFKYTENGPVGLLNDRKVYLVIASGGVDIDSPVDFATPYLRQALGFVGITDVSAVGARQAGRNLDDVLDQARSEIAELVYTAPRAA